MPELKRLCNDVCSALYFWLAPDWVPEICRIWTDQCRISGQVRAGENLTVDELLLEERHGGDQVRSVLADIAHTQHVARRKLKFHGQVPLLHFGRPHVGIPEPDVSPQVRIFGIQAAQSLIESG